jgi:F-type H+-transporting ATPase subunit epsilon
MALHFELTTPERIVERDEADSVTATTPLGEVTILPGHIPLVTPLVPGRVTIVRKGKESDIAVHGGFLEVRSDDVHGTKVILLADAAARAEEINEAEVEAAKAQAEQAMQDHIAGDDAKYQEAYAQYEQAIAMLRVAHRRRRHGQT